MFRRPRGLVLACAVCIVGSLVFAVPNAGAASSTIVMEPFTSSTVSPSYPDWSVDPGSSSEAQTGETSGVPCLTNPGTSESPIPNCGLGDDDFAKGHDGLLLTYNEDRSSNGPEVGGASYDYAFPTTEGLDATFDTYQWGGGSPDADGIDFFLAAVNPTNPPGTTAAPTLGGTGGALGYMPGENAADNGSVNGLSDGYLGFGLDTYKTYSTGGQDGCDDTGTNAANSITVRGPGSGTSGYCILGSEVPTGSLSSSSSPTAVPVEVAINPSSSAVTESSGLVIQAASWAIAVQTIGGPEGSTLGCPATYVCMSGLLPSASAFLPANMLNPATGIPDELILGFSAATGDSANYHLVNNLNASTILTPPSYSLSLTPSTGTASVTTGQSFTYSAAATVSSANETDNPVTITDSLPTGLNPNPSGESISGGGGTNSYCTSTTSPTATETCTLAPPVGGFAPGSVITATFGATVSASGPPSQVLTDQATVYSADDYLPVTQTAAVNYSPGVLVFTTQPVSAQVNQLMMSGGSPLAVTVAVEPPGGGPPISGLSGTVNLSVVDNGNSPSTEFYTATGDVTTLSAPLVNGVATFLPFGLTQVGGGYQVQATMAGFTPVDSSPFDSDQSVTTCGSGSTCTTTVTATTGTSATLVSGPGGAGTITASFGTTPYALPGCMGNNGPAVLANVLSFSSNRLEVIAYSLANAYPSAKSPYQNFQVCFGDATDDFITSSGQKAASVSGDPGINYAGYLPSCIQTLAKQPCVIGELKIGTTQDVAVLASGLDPKLSLNPPT